MAIFVNSPRLKFERDGKKCHLTGKNLIERNTTINLKQVSYKYIVIRFFLYILKLMRQMEGRQMEAAPLTRRNAVCNCFICFH